MPPLEEHSESQALQSRLWTKGMFDAVDADKEVDAFVDPDGNQHDALRYPQNDRHQVLFDNKRHQAALLVLAPFRERMLAKAKRTPAQLEFMTDATLLRYLRARDSNLEAAETMLEATLKWRAQHFDSNDGSERCCRPCETDPRSHCFFQLFTDTVGRKVLYSCAARASNKVIDDNMMHMAWEIEHLFGGRNSDPGKITWIIDMNGFGMLDLHPGMGSATFPMFANHFPERLSQIVLLDAPVIFSGLFKVIVPLLDPVTRNKIVFLKGHAQRTKWIQERIGAESGAAEWLEQVLKLPAKPGSFPPEAVCRTLPDPRARCILERCAARASNELKDKCKRVGPDIREHAKDAERSGRQ